MQGNKDEHYDLALLSLIFRISVVCARWQTAHFAPLCHTRNWWNVAKYERECCGVCAQHFFRYVWFTYPGFSHHQRLTIMKPFFSPLALVQVKYLCVSSFPHPDTASELYIYFLLFSPVYNILGNIFGQSFCSLESYFSGHSHRIKVIRVVWK